MSERWKPTVIEGGLTPEREKLLVINEKLDEFVHKISFNFATREPDLESLSKLAILDDAKFCETGEELLRKLNSTELGNDACIELDTYLQALKMRLQQ